MGQKKLGVYALACVILGGCTPATVAPVTGLSSAAKTVVIVPSLPDHLVVATRGVTVFGTALDQPSITDWGLDQLAYDTARSTLSSRFTVSEALPKTQLIDAQSRLDSSVDGDDGVAGLLQNNIDVSPAPDLYIVLCVSARSHPYAGDPAPLSPLSVPDAYLQDIGVSKKLTIPGLPGLPPVVHSFLELTLVDGKTMKVLYDTPLLMDPNENVSVTSLGIKATDPYPERLLPGFAWHDKWADMTPQQQAQVQADIRDMLTKSIAYTLQKALLTPAAAQN